MESVTYIRTFLVFFIFVENKLLVAFNLLRNVRTVRKVRTFLILLVVRIYACIYHNIFSITVLVPVIVLVLNIHNTYVRRCQIIVQRNIIMINVSKYVST